MKKKNRKKTSSGYKILNGNLLPSPEDIRRIIRTSKPYVLVNGAHGKKIKITDPVEVEKYLHSHDRRHRKAA